MMRVINMKKLSKVTSAESDGSSKLMETLDEIKDDFDYIISGLEKLDRSGAEASNSGLIIAEGIQSSFQDVIDEIASNM